MSTEYPIDDSFNVVPVVLTIYSRSVLCRNFHLEKGGAYEKETTLKSSTAFIEVYLIDYQQGKTGFIMLTKLYNYFIHKLFFDLFRL